MKRRAFISGAAAAPAIAAFPVEGGVRTPELITAIHGIKEQVVKEINIDIEYYEWTQLEAANALGLSQSDTSDIMNSKRLERFTLDRLLMMLIRLGHKPIVSVC